MRTLYDAAKILKPSKYFDVLLFPFGQNYLSFTLQYLAWSSVSALFFIQLLCGVMNRNSFLMPLAKFLVGHEIHFLVIS